MSITAHSLHNYQVAITAGNHQFVSDEPPGIGDDAGPEPFNLLLASLVSCTIITLQMYARRKNWPLEQVEMAADIRSVEVIDDTGQKSRSSVIETRLTFHGPLTREQLMRLEEIAARCPVHRTLLGNSEILTAVSNLEAL